MAGTRCLGASARGPADVKCPTCGASFMAFFVCNQGVSAPSTPLEFHETLLEECNGGMHSLQRIELMTE